MAKIAIIGEENKVTAFGLAGAIVMPADEPDAVRAAWRSLASDVAVVLLTPRAARAIADDGPPAWPLTVVMPP